MPIINIEINEPDAIREFRGLSQNARLYLQDRIGNNLQAVRINNFLGRREPAEQAIRNLIADLKELGLFETALT